MNYTTKIINLCKKTKQLNIVPYAQSFRYCNNNCKFCYLKDYMLKRPPTLEQVKIINDNVIKWLNSYLNEIPSDTEFSLNMIGGELFYLKDYYVEYKRLIDNVNNILKDRHLNIKLFSNLLYKDINPLLELYSYDNVSSIITSYDYKGRFTNDSLLLWLNNVNVLLDNDINVAIETVLTKEFINDFTNRKDKVYENLLKQHIKFGYNVIIPNREEQLDNIPSQEQLVSFFKYIYDNIKPTPDFDILHYKKMEEKEEKKVNIFSDCATIQFALPNETNPKFKSEDNLVVLYCDDILNISSFQNVSKFYKDNEIENDFICIKDEKRINYYYDNIYGCGTCKYKNGCSNLKLRDCFRIQSYLGWNNKCWKKKVLEYLNEQNI